MKIIRRLAGIAAIAASLAACNKDGGETIIGSKDDEVKLEDIDFTNAEVVYYGEYVEGLSNYTITLYNGEVDEDGYITGDAEVLYIDLYANKKYTASELPAGTYKCVSEDKLAEGTFCEGVEQTVLEFYQPYIDAGLITLKELMEEYTAAELNEPSGSIAGSEFYVQKLDGVDEDGDDNYIYTDFLFKAGTGSSVKISKNSDGKYSITVLASFETTDVVYTYSGAIEVVDGSDADDSGDDDDDNGDVDRSQFEVVSFNSFTQGELDYNGVSDGTYYWTIYLGDSNVNLESLEGKGKLLCLDLATTNTSKTELKAGEYKATGYTDCALIGYYESNGYAYGTMYVDNEEIVMGATDGSVNISKDGDTYTMDVELFDDDYKITYKAKITQKLTYADYSQSTSASPRLSNKAPRAPKAVNTVAPARPAKKTYKK